MEDKLEIEDVFRSYGAFWAYLLLMVPWIDVFVYINGGTHEGPVSNN